MSNDSVSARPVALEAYSDAFTSLDKVLGSTIPDLLQPVNQSLIDIHMGINFGISDSTSGLQPSIAPEQFGITPAQFRSWMVPRPNSIT